MTLGDIRKLGTYQTRSIAEVCKDPETMTYIMECLRRFYGGDYGIMPIEDVEANNYDLSIGEGHILARYEAKHNLSGDIYIEAHFSESVPGLDANNLLIMYCNER